MPLPKRMGKKAQKLSDHETYLTILARNAKYNSRRLKINFWWMLALTVTIAFMLLFLSFKEVHGKGRAKNKVFNFEKGTHLRGERPASFSHFIVSRKHTHHHKLYVMRNNFKKRIQKSVNDL